MQVQVNTYDVWGNDKDGYDVNDVYRQGEFEFDGNWNKDRDIFKFLKEIDILAKHVKLSNLEFEDFDCTVVVYRRRDHYPLVEVNHTLLTY